jgi:multidrug resistance efflux pump
MARSHPFRQAGEVLRKPADLEIAELEARVAAAKAALEAAQEEVQQVTVAAPVAGVVSRLDVRPGMTAEAGAPAWGEILDLSEIDVRCDLTPQEADGVAVGDVAVVMQEGVQDGHWAGQVVNVGAAADQQSGKVPVLVRVKNRGERLRCYVEVSVHFGIERLGDQEKEVPAVESNGVDRSRRGRTPLPARV